MSVGIGGLAKKVLEDDKTVIYEYGGINLNILQFRNEKKVLDGLITIDKKCFIEPEIHKKMPSRRKMIVSKRMFVDVDYPLMIEKKQIEITNCSNCWKIDENGIDITTGTLLSKIFYLYQIEGKIPKEVVFYK